MMATQSTVDLANQIVNSRILDRQLRNNADILDTDPLSPSFYTLACDQSILSGNVDRWIHGYPDDSVTQNSRVPPNQQQRVAPISSTPESAGLWYILALILPLFSLQNTMQWRCTPSAVLNSAEMIVNRVSAFCHEARAHIRRLARDHVTRDIFATAMDIVLVVYAIGFLVLTLCQATLIQ